MASKSGETIELSAGPFLAKVSSVGATLRQLAREGVPIAFCDAPGVIGSGSKGQVLAPWPNRLEDGRYRFGDLDGRAPIDEASTNCAIHGLVRFLDWSIVRRSDRSVLLRAPLAPQPAYPFLLELLIEYELSERGLEVRCSATNRDEVTIPFAIGFHPYLAPGHATIDSSAFSLPASRRVALDERGLPRANEPFADLGWQAGERLDLDRRVLDDCFTELSLESGRWIARFWPDKDLEREVELWGEGAFSYVMCYTAHTLAEPERRRGLAIEPMTAPPNALHTGESLIALAPGKEFAASWGISA